MCAGGPRSDRRGSPGQRGSVIPCAGPEASSGMDENGDLYDGLQAGELASASRHVGVPVPGVDGEYSTSRYQLAPQPRRRAEGVGSGTVLDEPAEEGCPPVSRSPTRKSPKSIMDRTILNLPGYVEFNIGPHFADGLLFGIPGLRFLFLSSLRGVVWRRGTPMSRWSGRSQVASTRPPLLRDRLRPHG